LEPYAPSVQRETKPNLPWFSSVTIRMVLIPAPTPARGGPSPRRSHAVLNRQQFISSGSMALSQRTVRHGKQTTLADANDDAAVALEPLTVRIATLALFQVYLLRMIPEQHCDYCDHTVGVRSHRCFLSSINNS